jgi:hypothetical protein
MVSWYMCTRLIAVREAAENAHAWLWGLFGPWHFQNFGMHDDALVVWDWLSGQNVGEGQQRLAGK